MHQKLVLNNIERSEGVWGIVYLSARIQNRKWCINIISPKMKIEPG